MGLASRPPPLERPHEPESRKAARGRLCRVPGRRRPRVIEACWRRGPRTWRERLGGWSPREAGPQPHASGSGRLPCAPRPLFAFGSPASPPSSSLGLVSRPLSSSAPKPPRPPPAGRLVNRWGLRGLEVANLSPGRHHREKQRSYDVLLEAGPSVAAQVMFRAGRLVTAGLSHAASPSLHPSVPGAPAPQAVTTKMPPATAGWSLGSKINPDGRPSP